MILELTDGNTVVTGTLRNVPKQIREGVVVKTLTDQRHPHYGRKIAKSVSDAYLFRKGNVSEYQ